jgi:hypothetical protein
MIIFTPNTVIKSADVNVNFAEVTDIKSGWISYTPTWTNLTVGNGTVTAAYKQIGKTVLYRICLIFGTTTSMGTNPFVTLPVTPITYPGVERTILSNFARFHDSGTASYVGFLQQDNSDVNRCLIVVLTTSTTYGQITNGLTATLPHTWAVNDEILVTGQYEAA